MTDTVGCDWFAPRGSGSGRASMKFVNASCRTGENRTRNLLHTESITGVRTGQSTSCHERINSNPDRYSKLLTSSRVIQFCRSTGLASRSLRDSASGHSHSRL